MTGHRRWLGRWWTVRRALDGYPTEVDYLLSAVVVPPDEVPDGGPGG